MLKGWLIAVLASVGWMGATAAEPEPTVIRVLVADRAETPLVEVTGRYRVTNPQTGQCVSWGWLGKCYTVQAGKEGLCWGEEFPGTYQLAIQPAGTRSSVLVNGVQYRGTVVLYQVGDQISVVNEVPVDYYCKVILAPQFKRPRSPEVMAAVAIVARTRAYWEVAKQLSQHYDVKADEVGYFGHAVLHSSPAAAEAVDNTRHIVMEEGTMRRTFPAVWTEDCAGHTAPYQVIFRTPGYEGKGIESPLAAHHREETAWEVAVPAKWLANAAQLDDISRINLYTDGLSHKVYAIRLSNGTVSTDLDFAALQTHIGMDRLLSNDFTARIEGSDVIFTGYGRGHGVGVCLYTAEQLASRGKNAADILEAFYPKASLRICEPESTEKSVLARLFTAKGSAS